MFLWCISLLRWFDRLNLEEKVISQRCNTLHSLRSNISKTLLFESRPYWTPMIHCWLEIFKAPVPLSYTCECCFVFVLVARGRVNKWNLYFQAKLAKCCGPKWRHVILMAQLEKVTYRNKEVYQTWKRARLLNYQLKWGLFRSNIVKSEYDVGSSYATQPLSVLKILRFKKSASTFSIAFWNSELILNCTWSYHFCEQFSTEDNLRTNIKLRDINLNPFTAKFPQNMPFLTVKSVFFYFHDTN